jgi:hypothetical protein
MPMRTWSDTRRRPFVLPGWVGSFQKGLATCTAFGSKSYAGGDGRIAKESLMRGSGGQGFDLALERPGDKSVCRNPFW